MVTISEKLIKIAEESDYVPFKQVARQLDEQVQYASRLLKDHILGEGIRWIQEDLNNYHTIKIHKNDIDKFINRVYKERG